jgi:hypothetical protein
MHNKLLRLWLLLTLVGTCLSPAHGAQSSRAAGRSRMGAQGIAASPRRPLWPGARFTEADRARAIRRGLQFIYRTALKRANFDQYGDDYVWCFYTISATIDDPIVQRMAERMGVERARVWRRLHRTLPRDADAATIVDYVSGNDAADSLGVRDEQMKATLRRVAGRFSARDYLSFDPLSEPPPTDVPDECEYDGAENSRGAKVCRVCHRPLQMKTRYDVWYDALITAYTGDRYGVTLGAHYADVLKWLPTLRPYPAQARGDDFLDSIYAITHVVYTLNDYNQTQLAPRLLPAEYEYLRAHLRDGIALKDTDMLGEMMDSLRAFGVTEADKDMRAAIEFYLTHQNRDGSWGDTDDEDIYNRYHPTWNAIDGLSRYTWRGKELSHPELKPLLEQWAKESDE